MKLSEALSCDVIWEVFEAFSLEKVAWILGAVGVTSCVLDPCPSWLVNASWEKICMWSHAMVNASLREGMIPLKEVIVYLLFVKASRDATDPDNFFPKFLSGEDY